MTEMTQMAERAVSERTTPETWAARLDVQALVVDYQAALDEKRFDDAVRCFTDDGSLQFDDTPVTGHEAIAASMQRQLAVLDVTHHTVANVRVRLGDGGADATTATLSAQVIGSHLWTVDGESKQTVQGGHYEATVQRTPVGWRFSLLEPSFVWTIGDPWEH